MQAGLRDSAAEPSSSGSVFSEYNGHLSSKDVFLSSVIQHTIPGTLRCSSNALSLASGISALIMVYITNV